MDIVKTGLKLFAITLVAAACLGAVNAITKPVIMTNDKITKERAMAEVLPGLSDVVFSEETLTGEKSGVTSYYTAMNSASDCYVFFVTVQGDQGEINCAVGMDNTGKTLGVKLVSHNETPGLGANAAKADFLGKFKGVTGPFTVVKAPPRGSSEIEAISSATHTTQAVANAANAALEFFNNLLKR